MRPTRARLPARARAVARDFGNLNNYYIKQVLPMILVTYNTTNTTNKRVQRHTLTLDRDPKWDFLSSPRYLVLREIPSGTCEQGSCSKHSLAFCRLVFVFACRMSRQL